MQMQVHIRLLYFVKKIKLFILIVLVLNTNKFHEEIKEFMQKFPINKNTKTNSFRVQEDNSIMCGYFGIGYIDFMLAGRNLTDYTNVFSPHDLKKTII